MSSDEPATPSTSFFDHLEARHVVFRYEIDDFLYGHEGPSVQVCRDHPFGEAPEVLNIPPQEWDDWRQNVEKYYLDKATEFGIQASEFSAEHFLRTGLVGYAEVSDADFTKLLCEGLYSKFLCPTLDPIDRQRFASLLIDPDRYEYLKSDYSCMTVIQDTWQHEYVAPTVVLLRRPLSGDPYAYEVVAVALSYWDGKQFVWLDAPLTPGPGEEWRLAKYFVLQGAVHRINLIDHTEVHFPSDAINAISKSVLPTRNLVLQLLEPHLRLQLPVNNTVLEGQRSLINRDTWYPWSPFVAKGDEVRKLLPFGWYGSRYAFDEPNSAYPPYRFALQPRSIPSRYGAYVAAYHKPIRDFVHRVVEQLPTDELHGTDWTEIQAWAMQISAWLPGFPGWSEFVARTPEERARAVETLTDTLTMVILNAAVVHSMDHTTLHKMMNEQPVPFVLRVTPPHSLPAPQASPAAAPPPHASAPAAPTAHPYWSFFKDVFKKAGEKVQHFAAHVMDSPFVTEHLTPLCWPTDLIYARMADLLFYMPHNVSLLIDCDYRFAQTAGPLGDAVVELKAGLRSVAAAQAGVVKEYGFPLLEPPPGLTPEKDKRVRVQECLGAGIQY